MNQIELHKKIDELLKKNPTEAKPEDASILISANDDAHQYFFTKADERWLDWLWVNGFLGVIKQKAEDPTRYGYRTPEINYLVRMAEKVPAKVVDIMQEVKVSTETFNPDVVDRFLWICSTLPADQLARVVKKIRDEKWIPLMGVFNRWGFEYEKMLKALADANDYENILVLADAILTVRPKEEVSKEGFAGISTENPFYFNDLSYTKVFEHLASVNNEYTEQALGLVTKVMAQIVKLGGDAEKGDVFPIKETFHLFDVDFFALELGKKERLSHREDVRELAAVIKKLSEKTIGSHDTDPWRAKELYNKYFESLPDSRSMWRLKLFVHTLYPEYFKDELKSAFSRLFSVERYYNEIISGTEYLKALRAGFSVLSDTDKRDYVKGVINYFTKQDREKENEKENWHLVYGSRILSVITDQLTEEEKQTAKSAGFTLDPSYEPEPSIGRMRAGSVRPRGPITAEEFGKIPVEEIARKLRIDWTPEKLRSQNVSDDFLNPLNAEGVGGLLRADISKRLQEYIDSAPLFFKRDVLDQHYTYSFLRGIEEILRDKKVGTENINWDSLITLLISIEKSGEAKAFDYAIRKHESFDAWLSGWAGVHSAVGDVLQELISESGGKTIINFPTYRNNLFVIIRYLLTCSDPVPEDETEERSDPYTTAINTARGRAFQAFALFAYQDSKKFPEDSEVKVDNDVKKVYEWLLKRENTRAIMFMFGHYLPSFYFRDRTWVRGLLPQIFPTEPQKKDLYLAAWEGYLANNLFEEMFFDADIQKLYERGVALALEEYAKRKYFRDPDEGIATHLALAFMYYEKFGFNHPLFKAFWEGNDFERQGDFISFLGRSFISGENPKNNALLRDKPRSKIRLREFWDWVLEHCRDPKPLTMFGFWINIEKDVFETSWLAERVRKTLEKTGGILEWEYGLIQSIQNLAKSAPVEAFNILLLFLLEGGVRSKRLLMPFSVEHEWFDVFKTLYAEPTTKDKIYNLIDDLIREGGSMFWKLKEILEN